VSGAPPLYWEAMIPYMSSTGYPCSSVQLCKRQLRHRNPGRNDINAVMLHRLGMQAGYTNGLTASED